MKREVADSIATLMQTVTEANVQIEKLKKLGVMVTFTNYSRGVKEGETQINLSFALAAPDPTQAF